MGKKIHHTISGSQDSLSHVPDKPHNRLFFEQSPYLLQHAHNPVDWYPWGSEAFEKAQRENKPIFLSIGYSTCHWCHVMEHESFEDPEVARLMNDTFVPIKVDREERPDLDNIYMIVCQMTTGHGGWPLSIFMTPDKKPFFAATYIPKETRSGQIGLLQLIPRIKELWVNRQGEVVESSDTITASLHQMAQDLPGEAQDLPGDDLDESVLAQCFEQLAAAFDGRWGGFGNAPKFPIPHNILFLLRYWKRTGNQKALAMVEKTLQSMRMGGIYDHLGFGFHRYSTDAEWLVPHFEKMLYDQALLAMAYTEAYQATGKEQYGRTAQEIFSYVLRDMTSPEGGFYSAEDADSEGEEGKFYLWTLNEIRDILDSEEAELFIRAFAIDSHGNFIEQTTGERSGTNILHLERSIVDLASQSHLGPRTLNDHLDRARSKLFAARQTRARPFKDDKILTDWNGLMIAALAKGAQVFDDPSLATAAQTAADFILGGMCASGGRLLHRYRGGQAGLHATIDDYAFLGWGLLELYEATFEERYLLTALTLNERLLEHFWDEARGGLYFTADDDEELLIRRKEIYDGALPSGNSVATMNFIRLSRMTGEHTLEEKASRLVRAFSRSVRQSPSSYTHLLLAVDFMIGPGREVVIAGDPLAMDTKTMLRAVRAAFVPNKVILFRPVGPESHRITEIASFTQSQSSINGQATAYVCTNNTCSLPTTDIKRMLELLDAGTAANQHSGQ